jgi:diguanylate cyclase (GGDEF)-like protein
LKEELAKKVLLVEDNKDHAELIKLKLVNHGYKVEMVGKGEEALSLPHLSSFDALLCDFALPQMNGIELITELKRRKIDVPVIMMSTQGDRQIFIRAIKEGAFYYIVKEANFDFLELLPPVIEKARKRYLIGWENKELSKKLRAQTKKLTELKREFAQLSITDPLTNIYNRCFLSEALKLELNRASRHFEPVTLVILYLDDFEQINKTYGDSTGDKILTKVASMIANGVRKGDVLARYGGKELALLLPATDTTNGTKVALRVKRVVAGHRFPLRGELLTLTLSAGVVGTDDFSTTNPEALLEEGGKRLITAKKKGRDQLFPSPNAHC